MYCWAGFESESETTHNNIASNINISLSKVDHKSVIVLFHAINLIQQ